MRCPHCAVHVHEDWVVVWMSGGSSDYVIEAKNPPWQVWSYRSTKCPNCKNNIIEIGLVDRTNAPVNDWRLVHPVTANRGPVSPVVPGDIVADYLEACAVLPISPKASAALSRRCLQNMLHAHSYTDRDLAKEIDLLLNESDPQKALPYKLRVTVDGIRHFGNFSAHPVTDKTSLQVIEVEPEEAEWCLEIIEELFEHFYVGPAAARAKKAALDAKLAAANKPPSKS